LNFSNPVSQLSSPERNRWRVWLQTVWRYLHLLTARFIADNCLSKAAALAYTTLLSLVPLMTLGLGMLAVFPQFQSLQIDIQHFIFSNFVPTTGEVVQAYFQTFTGKTSQLTAIGIGFLIAAALLMVRTIDDALNEIWHTSRQRSAVRSFLVYWAVLTVAPLLTGISIFVTSYLISLPWFVEVSLQPGPQLLGYLPFALSTLVFTLFYWLIPNRRVPWRYALFGGMLAALLFNFAKWGFALYVTHSDVYQTIYGTLATIPLFLMWIYLSWVVVLLGAEITYCLSIFHWQNPSDTLQVPDTDLVYVFRILGYLWMAQRRGEAMSVEAMLAQEGWQDETRLLGLLRQLRLARWVYRSHETHHWGLARDLGDTPVYELYQLMSNGLNTPPTQLDAWNQNLARWFGQLHHCTHDLMQVSLKTLYQTPASDAAPVADLPAPKPELLPCTLLEDEEEELD